MLIEVKGECQMVDSGLDDGHCSSIGKPHCIKAASDREIQQLKNKSSVTLDS